MTLAKAKFPKVLESESKSKTKQKTLNYFLQDLWDFVLASASKPILNSVVCK